MGRRKSMLGAAQTRDAKTVYETVLDGLSECFDATKSARDKARLGSEIMKAQAKLDELAGSSGSASQRKPNVTEVPQLEVIAKRRSERRKAAEA